MGENRAGGGGSLDSFGRTVLQAADYRWIAIAILASVVAFTMYRRLRYRSWPTIGDCLQVVYSLLALCSALIVFVVFVLTKPPAINALSGTELSMVGLLTIIAVFGRVFPDLKELINPSEFRGNVPTTLQKDSQDRAE